ncbi:MAG: primosomal protein N' [Candidatus Poribacteria bacterium]|nr:primosomal protein N' [Candidatus Poribacteria bacterium]MDE0506109.1 primosomal protein N' [Candidatus Poribacteria bacterium]
MNYANVVFPLPQDLSFTYAIPDRLKSNVHCGSRVVAPLGRRFQEGVIVALLDEPALPERSIEIKNLSDCLDGPPTFSSELILLTRWMAGYYLSSHGEALSCAVPAIIRSHRRRIVHLLATDGQIEAFGKRARVQAEILRTLQACGSLSPNQLTARLRRDNSSLKRALNILQGKGLVEIRSDLSVKTKPKIERFVSLKKSVPEIESEVEHFTKRAPKQHEILRLLINIKQPISTTEISRRARTNFSTLKQLEKKKLVKIDAVEVLRNPLSLESVSPNRASILNADQLTSFKAISRAIKDNQHKVFLLHGVTGSGKTEVYMQAISRVIDSGKGAIVLVPEISLTPQIVSRFVGRFGSRVAILHSNLSDGERFDQWHRIRAGNANVVVGPRSAIFAPVTNLGIIVVDEEHETSYKQEDTAPRYHARDVAVKRAELANCPLVLGSATPSLESYHLAQRGDYDLLRLPSRVKNIKMPPVRIVDMCNELKRNNRTIFSTMLRNAIKDRLGNNEQIILFLNRRGYSSYVFCRACGFVEQCDNCSISLTFHFDTKSMMCHHCGDARSTSNLCPECGSPYMRYFGLGTEQVEQDTIKAFPQASVKRMDADSTSRKDAHQKILDAFKTREIDILVGTQMIAKGLDFPNVTLVGVISADTALNFPDFRAGERSFNLLTQVAGRSGRGKAGGEVIIQTYMPKHYSVRASKTHDYLSFYRQEIAFREELLYPPLTHAATLLLRGEVETEVIRLANRMLERLRMLKTEQFPDVEIRGPVAAPLSKIMGKYRWHFFLRNANVEKLREFVQKAVRSTDAPRVPKNIDLVVDIDPVTVL